MRSLNAGSLIMPVPSLLPPSDHLHWGHIGFGEPCRHLNVCLSVTQGIAFVNCSRQGLLFLSLCAAITLCSLRRKIWTRALCQRSPRLLCTWSPQLTPCRQRAGIIQPIEGASLSAAGQQEKEVGGLLACGCPWRGFSFEWLNSIQASVQVKGEC